MTQKLMTRDAKSALSKTIRALRTRLLADLSNAVDSRYRMRLGAHQANLAPHVAADRARLEAWLSEQQRAEGQQASNGKSKSKKATRTRDDFRAELEAEAAYTWLHRLVVVRLMEEAGLIKPALLSRGRDSSAYRQFRDWSPELLGDETEGYGSLLQVLFDELALDLPGLFGSGLIDVVPMPPATLRAMVDALSDPALDSCWADDTTLGWVYQYWNDPAREALDAKLNSGGKVEPHEVASKTQLFTERYMVEWLLQNSLGTMWLAICRKNGWTADCLQPGPRAASPPEDAVEGLTGTLLDLEQRRIDWRARREASEVELDELMPIYGDLEDRWKYWVPQPIPDDAVRTAPDSIADLKLLDPACGSGHFLVIAFDYLYTLYEEEARHRSPDGAGSFPATLTAAIDRILSHNLHGIDIDARCIQIAAAALYLKARAKDASFRPSTMNLVAPNLPLARLPDDDPALVEFRRAVTEETGIEGGFVDQLLDALEDAYHLGSLLKVEDILAQAMRSYDARALLRASDNATATQSDGGAGTASSPRDTLLDNLEPFLDRHTGRDDLGLRLYGEQLAAGIRFVRMIAEGTYDIVVANPPYCGTSKIAASKYLTKHYKRSKADLFAAFLERGLELVRADGFSAMVTMRNWMFIKTYEDLRKNLERNFDIRLLGDIGTYAFEQMADHVRAVLSIMRARPSGTTESVAINVTEEEVVESNHTEKRRAALLAQVGRCEFSVDALKGIEGQPLIYWWDDDFLRRYVSAPKIDDVAECREGLGTRDDNRFVRRPWELLRKEIFVRRYDRDTDLEPPFTAKWVPFIKGAAGRRWYEPLDYVVHWQWQGAHISLYPMSRYGRGAEFYFTPGVAVATIGSHFSARMHLYSSVFGARGLSVFPRGSIPTPLELTRSLNSAATAYAMTSLNPGITFMPNDVKRAPFWPTQPGASNDGDADAAGFWLGERRRETSIEFAPADWEGASSQSIISIGVGVSVGRLSTDRGWVDEAPAALPYGILYTSASEAPDSLDHPACEFLKEAWEEHGTETRAQHGLSTWLRERWFVDVHKDMYENRPIYFPLSSQNKNFVAHVSIHRWTEDTLRHLLADHLYPDARYLQGLREDLAQARASDNRATARDAEDRLATVTAWLEELNQFIADVEQCAEKGPPPTDAKCTPREVDARYAPDLDDGVMINSAALWPLLEPQWKDPAKWWKQLANETGFRGKHFDWARLAARYWPTRVDAKCQEDPSLAVAHGCFWKYHPERAYEWELRLQHEIEPEFTIDEESSDEYRPEFLSKQPQRAREIHDAEMKRREKEEAKKVDEERQTNLADLSVKLNEVADADTLIAFREFLYATAFGIRDTSAVVSRIAEQVRGFDAAARSDIAEVADVLGFYDSKVRQLTPRGSDFVRGLHVQTKVLESVAPHLTELASPASRSILRSIEAGLHADIFWSERQVNERDNEVSFGIPAAAYAASLPEPIEDDGEELIIPDAHRFSVLARLLEGVGLGFKEKHKLRWYLGVKTERTVDRYIRQARQVKLVQPDAIALTDRGSTFVFRHDQRVSIARNAFQRWEVVSNLIERVDAGQSPVAAAEELLRSRTTLSGETVTKRARGLTNWLTTQLHLLQRDLFDD